MPTLKGCWALHVAFLSDAPGGTMQDLPQHEEGDSMEETFAAIPPFFVLAQHALVQLLVLATVTSPKQFQ